MNKRSPTASYPNHHRRKRRESAAAAEEPHQPLLPGLPDDIAHSCLSLVPPSTLYSVCRRWRRLIYSPSFPPFLSLYAVVSSADRSLNHITDPIEVISFDPISSKWDRLPPPPPSDDFLLRHRSYIARNFPVQTLTAAGNLLVLAGTNGDFLPALPRPLVLDPLTKKWARGPAFSAPRRYCVVGAVGGAVHVASGIGARYAQDIARSVERWEILSSEEDRWRPMGGQKDTRFCREAIEAVGWRGKLCMVNVKGHAAKDGAVYDAGADSWEEMPRGMLRGWTGPAAAMDEETIYVADEKKGMLRKYDALSDAWVEVAVAESRLLEGAHQLAAAGGRVCALCADGCKIAVVDVATGGVTVVEAPAGVHVIGIHILPRSIGRIF